MPSVLHVVTTINRGGAENHLATLTTEQASRGWSVAIAYLKGDGYWTAEFNKSGVEVIPLSWSGYTDLSVIRRLRELIEARRPTILHAHLPAAEVFTRLARAGARVQPRFIISKHSDDPISTPLFWAGGFWAERGAASVIAISHAVANYLRRQHRLSASKVFPIHYGLEPAAYDQVPPDTIRAIRQQWGIAEGEIVVGTVARIVTQKRIDLLIDALASLRARGLPLKLVVVGAGPLEARLRRRAAQKNVTEAVVWAGRREDIPAVMQALDIFALCSDYEGFGLVLLESMASRRPIVATRVSAIPEIVVDGTTGYLCEPGNADSIAASIEKLCDCERRKSFGEAGRARLERDFTVSKMVDATLALYSAENADAGAARRAHAATDS
jgi:glycosyltransferase involved in cell wall biosynthesis